MSRILLVIKSVAVLLAISMLLFVSASCSSADKKPRKDVAEATQTPLIESDALPVTPTDNAFAEDDETTKGESDVVIETILPVETTDSVVSTDTPSTTPAVTATPGVVPSQDATYVPTVEPAATAAPTHTPITPAEKEEIIKDLAASFFHGEWESESGMIYNFNSTDGSVDLKEKSTGELLLSGTYESFSDDYTEYELTLTFNGESDTYIAWKYSDTGAVRLIIGETGATYDLLWRAS